MNKWSDYVITAKRENPDGTHIDEVKVRAGRGNNLGTPSVETRDKVIYKIKKICKEYCTAFKEGGKWKKGSDVHVVNPDGGEPYIRTDGNEKEEDNLGDLPNF